MRVAISGFLTVVGFFFLLEKADPAALGVQETNIFPIQFSISIKAVEFLAVRCTQLLRRDGSSSRAPLSEILFSHFLNLFTFQTGIGSVSHSQTPEKKRHFIHFHPITERQQQQARQFPLSCPLMATGGTA